MVAEIWASVISSFVDQLVALIRLEDQVAVNSVNGATFYIYTERGFWQLRDTRERRTSTEYKRYVTFELYQPRASEILYISSHFD